MAEWVEKGSLKGSPGEIPDVSDFLKDQDVSSSITGASDKVASDKAVKDYVDSLRSDVDGHTHADATAASSGFMSAQDKAKLDSMRPIEVVEDEIVPVIGTGSEPINALAIVDDLEHPSSGIVLKADPDSNKAVITGVGDNVVDEIHVADVGDVESADGNLAVNVNTLKSFVPDVDVPSISLVTWTIDDIE